jgi:hypothetical protein
VRPVTKTEKIAAEDLLDQAAALGIPWDRILEDEIRAERALRLCLADVNEDWPIWPAFWILPLSLFDSCGYATGFRFLPGRRVASAAKLRPGSCARFMRTFSAERTVALPTRR